MIISGPLGLALVVIAVLGWAYSLGSDVLLGYLEDLRQQRSWADLNELNGPPPWDPEHEDYMRELEHATILPLGVDPRHCVDCHGYAVTNQADLSLRELTA